MAMSEPLILRNVRSAPGKSFDLYIKDGHIQVPEEVRDFPARTIDCDGALALPGMVEAHTHLDKNFLGLPWVANDAGPMRAQKICRERELKRRLKLDAGVQADRQIRRCVALGTTHIRSHIDVDDQVGTRSIEQVLEVRAKWSDRVDIELVAFPQSGCLVLPGTLDMMARAMELGADVVGGIDPASIDRDPRAHLDAIFGLADRYGRPVDIHLHEPGELGAFCLELIIERVLALSMQGRCVVSHCYCLGMLPAERTLELCKSLAAAGISIMTTGPAGRPAPPLTLLRAAGVEVCSGTDGIRGAFEPFGRGDMLQRASALAEKNGFYRDEDLAFAFSLCSSAGARALGHSEHGTQPGQRADLVLVDAETLGEAIIDQPPRKLVIKHGRIVAENGRTVE
jgi:cytosine/adenosine deaminase-related metal-dependent hydrolase